MKIIYNTRAMARGRSGRGCRHAAVHAVEPVIGMALYSARAILHGRGGTSGKGESELHLGAR
jgi:hypothetical protein